MGDTNGDMLMSGATCYHVINEYFDVPEGTTGFRIVINGNHPAMLVFLKSTWDNGITQLFKGTTTGEVDLEFQRKLASALGVKDTENICGVEVEVKSTDEIVTTTIKQYTTQGQLEDCLKLLKGESQ